MFRDHFGCPNEYPSLPLGQNRRIHHASHGKSARPGEGHVDLPSKATDRAIARFDRIRCSKGKTGAGAIRLAMQRTMQRHCAVFRDGPLLDEGRSKLDSVIGMMRDDLSVTDRSMIFNSDLAEALELDNMLAQANVSLHSAIGRTESRGAHAREDFSKRDDRIGSSIHCAGSMMPTASGSTTGRCISNRSRMMW